MLLRACLLSLSFLFLAACGGGGSSSGGSSATAPAPTPSPAPTPEPASIDGEYSGVWTVTFSAPGVPDETDDFAIFISISGDMIEITDTDFVATGMIRADNTFSARTATITTSIDGIPCVGEFTFAGRVDANAQQVRGNSVSQLTCTFSGTSLRIDITGPYVADRSSAKLGGGSFRDGLRRFLN